MNVQGVYRYDQYPRSNEQSVNRNVPRTFSSRIDGFVAGPLQYFQQQDGPFSYQSSPVVHGESSRNAVRHGSASGGSVSGILDQVVVNPDIVSSLDVQSLTREVNAAPWQPSHASNGNSRQTVSLGWQANNHFHMRGPMSDPTPNHDILELSSSTSDSLQASEAADSSFQSLQGPFNHANHGGYGSYGQMDNRGYTSFDAGLQSPSEHGHTRPELLISASEGRTPKLKDYTARRRAINQPTPACPVCNKPLRNKSEQTKHLKQHSKPHRCDVPGCDRSAEGFATPNDLERHRKCKHQLTPNKGSTIGYVCCVCPVLANKGPKWWPRLDNFKAHIKRKHKTLSEEDIISRSQQEMRPLDAVSEGASVFGASTYYSASHADIDSSYQQQDYSQALNVQVPSLGQPSQQGESLWLDVSPAVATVQELEGVGEAHHLTDPSFLGRDAGFHEPNSGYNDDPNMGLSILCNAATSGLMTPLSNYQGQDELPEVTFTPCYSTSVKRFSEDPYQGMRPVKRRQSEAGDMIEVATEQLPEGGFKCRHCQKTKKRQCDLRKHIKRHNRPYGCTFAHCYRRHGSRSDWKRHEEKAHGRGDSWVCVLASPSDKTNNPCMKLFFSDSELRKHLKSEHSINDQDALARHCEDMQHARRGQKRFWCGFCQQIISQREGVRNAWEARCEHIGDHFDKEKRSVDGWWCLAGKNKKGNISKDEQAKARPKVTPNADEEEELSDLGESGIIGIEQFGRLGVMDT